MKCFASYRNRYDVVWKLITRRKTDHIMYSVLFSWNQFSLTAIGMCGQNSEICERKKWWISFYVRLLNFCSTFLCCVIPKVWRHFLGNPPLFNRNRKFIGYVCGVCSSFNWNFFSHFLHGNSLGSNVFLLRMRHLVFSSILSKVRAHFYVLHF